MFNKKSTSALMKEHGLNLNECSAEDLKNHNTRDFKTAVLAMPTIANQRSLEGRIGTVLSHQNLIIIRQNELLARQNEKIIHQNEELAKLLQNNTPG